MTDYSNRNAKEVVKLDPCKLRTAGPLSIFRFLCLELNVDPDDLPFDLFEHQGEVVENMIGEKMIDYDKPVQTISGARVEILKTNVDNSIYPVVGIIEIGIKGTAWEPDSWTREGVYDINDDEVGRRLNLMNVPEKHVYWLNFYPMNWTQAALFNTREDADKAASKIRIACVRVECEDGEGISD